VTNTRSLIRAAWARGQNPALVGPPRWGKDHQVIQAAIEDGIAADDIFVLYPQAHAEEEIAGIPILPPLGVRECGWTYPTAIPGHFFQGNGSEDRPRLLLLSELDKARPTQLSVFMRLFDSNPTLGRTLGHYRLHPGVRLAVTMNEAETGLPDALLARLLWLAYPTQTDLAEGVTDKEGGPLVAVLFPVPPPVAIPQVPKSPNGVRLMRAWFNYEPFWSNEGVRLRVLAGMFSAEQVPAVVQYLTDQVPTGDPKETLAKLGPTNAVRVLIRVLPQEGDTGWVWWEALAAQVEAEQAKGESDAWTRTWNLLAVPEVVGLIGHDHTALQTVVAKVLGAEGRVEKAAAKGKAKK